MQLLAPPTHPCEELPLRHYNVPCVVLLALQGLPNGLQHVCKGVGITPTAYEGKSAAHTHKDKGWCMAWRLWSELPSSLKAYHEAYATCCCAALQ